MPAGHNRLTPYGSKTGKQPAKRTGKIQGEERVLSALRADPDTPLDCKTLARRTRLSYRYVRELLPRMVLSQKIERVRRGWYKIPISGPRDEVLIELRLENLVVVAKTGKSRPRGGEVAGKGRTYTPGQTTFDSLSRREGPPGLERDKERVFFEMWPVAISTFDNGTVEVQLGAGGAPGLTIVSFVKFGGWLEGRFPEIADDGPEGWQVKTWEWNRDFPGLRMEGVKSLTLRAAGNAWLKLYQKTTGALRVELRQRLRQVSMREALEVMQEAVERLHKLGLIRVEDLGPEP